MTDAIRAAAHTYAQRGWAVIPLHDVTAGPCSCHSGADCKSPGKHPRIPEWESRWTKDPAWINRWWDWAPSANVGLVTGTPSGFWVLDEDPAHGGDVALAALMGLHPGDWPRTYKVRTGSGGTHYYWAMPADQPVGNHRGQLPPGIDVRGTGGFVVAPPSVSGVGPYVVLDDPGFPIGAL